MKRALLLFLILAFTAFTFSSCTFLESVVSSLTEETGGSGTEGTKDPITAAPTGGTGSAEAADPAAAPDRFDLSGLSGTLLSGGAAGKELFSGKDVTLVNCWTTWCGYCIAEFPEMQKLYEQLPENYGIVLICMDSDEAPETAKSQLTETGLKAPCVMVDDYLRAAVDGHLKGYPTTFVVGRDGKPIAGAEVMGAPKDPVTYYRSLLDKAYESGK